MSLLPKREGKIGIIAKEAGSEETQDPCSDFRVVPSLNKDKNGSDQVEDRCNESPEEITPGPVDEWRPGMQVTHVDDKEDNSQDHLNH